MDSRRGGSDMKANNPLSPRRRCSRAPLRRPARPHRPAGQETVSPGFPRSGENPMTIRILNYQPVPWGETRMTAPFPYLLEFEPLGLPLHFTPRLLEGTTTL